MFSEQQWHKKIIMARVSHKKKKNRPYGNQPTLAKMHCTCAAFFLCLSFFAAAVAISVASRPAFKAWRIVGVKKTITYSRLALIFWTCKFQLVKMCKGWPYYLFLPVGTSNLQNWGSFGKGFKGSNIFELTPSNFYKENWFNCFDAGIIFKPSRMKDVEELI